MKMVAQQWSCLGLDGCWALLSGKITVNISSWVLWFWLSSFSCCLLLAGSSMSNLFLFVSWKEMWKWKRMAWISMVTRAVEIQLRAKDGAFKDLSAPLVSPWRLPTKSSKVWSFSLFSVELKDGDWPYLSNQARSWRTEYTRR